MDLPIDSLLELAGSVDSAVVGRHAFLGVGLGGALLLALWEVAALVSFRSCASRRLGRTRRFPLLLAVALVTTDRCRRRLRAEPGVPDDPRPSLDIGCAKSQAKQMSRLSLGKAGSY